MISLCHHGHTEIVPCSQRYGHPYSTSTSYILMTYNSFVLAYRTLNRALPVTLRVQSCNSSQLIFNQTSLTSIKFHYIRSFTSFLPNHEPSFPLNCTRVVGLTISITTALWQIATFENEVRWRIQQKISCSKANYMHSAFSQLVIYWTCKDCYSIN